MTARMRARPSSSRLRSTLENPAPTLCWRSDRSHLAGRHGWVYLLHRKVKDPRYTQAAAEETCSIKLAGDEAATVDTHGGRTWKRPVAKGMSPVERFWEARWQRLSPP